MRRLVALSIVLLVAITAMALDVGDQVRISVRETELRSSAGFLSRVTAKLAYLDEVTILTVQNDWLQVEVRETRATGWIHSSSVAEPKELQLTGGGSGQRSGASNREIALAGRGFNEQVEEQIKTDSDLAPYFDVVDEMEGYIMDAETAITFLRDAGLAPETGGAE